jgi:hypothetical protein
VISVDRGRAEDEGAADASQHAHCAQPEPHEPERGFARGLVTAAVHASQRVQHRHEGGRADERGGAQEVTPQVADPRRRTYARKCPPSALHFAECTTPGWGLTHKGRARAR